MVIDTPGLRELQPWSDEESLSRTFADIEEWSQSCRFRDCSHYSEPGCAVRQAVREGQLSHRRLDNFHKLLREVERMEIREEKSASWQERRRRKDTVRVHKEAKRFKRQRNEDRFN
jgi:ribosome biogenesis GTPase